MQASLALWSFDVDEESSNGGEKEVEERSLRSFACLVKFLSLWPTGAFLLPLGTATIVQLAYLFVDLDRDLPDEGVRSSGMVLRCPS